MTLPDSIITAIREHAAVEYPRECCGLVVIIKGRRKYLPCRNIAEGLAHFEIHPEDAANAEDMGEIAMVVHSHPNLPAKPSQDDLVGCEKSGVPWLIINWPVGTMYEFSPSGYVAPLYGRQFFHGSLDCYTFVQDYYQRELGITLPDFQRPDQWWLKGLNLYREGFAAAGFEIVSGEPQKHDGLLMRVASQVDNHAAIYLGDGCIGHHQSNRLSSRDQYSGWYHKVTTEILRHRSFIK